MQTYLVGGAVRDQLLGLPVHERDWVITGATAKQMLQQGYTQVGNDFPVFLHPKTKDEYALARTERKQGEGYTGFTCNTSTEITLEQDLLRRDLTVNAMAMASDGTIIDPYQGQKDLNDRILRHVSDAFIEDPLRVLRVARFTARYHHLGFTIAPETLTLMQTIADSGELAALTPERIWKETARSLLDDQPQVYIQTLRDCNALATVFPELDALWGVPNPAQWHPEIDTGVHTLMVVTQACKLSKQLPVRFAALVHDLGKAQTPSEKWPSHKGHEALGVKIITQLCERLKIPNDCKELAVIMSQYHSHVHRLLEYSSDALLAMLNGCDVWRKPERFEQFLLCCEADARGRKGFEDSPYPQRAVVRTFAQQSATVDVQAIIKAGHKGPEIKRALAQQRLTIIQNIIEQYRAEHNNG